MTETADFLNISQSALSKSITSLEKELGTPLFDRVGKKLKLNAAGREFAKHIDVALAALNEAVANVEKLRFEQSGSVTIANYAHFTIFSDVFSEYQKLNPHVTFAISNSDRDISLENVDIILYTSNSDITNQRMEQFWVSQQLFREGFVVMMAPSLVPEGVEDEISLPKLKDFPFIAMSFKGHLFLRDTTYTLCQNAGFTPKVTFQCNDFLLKVRLVEKGSGVAIIPECCVADAKAIAPSVKFLKIKDCDLTRSVSVMRRKKESMTETALDFWNYLMDHYNITEENLD